MNLDRKIRQHKALDHVRTQPIAGDPWHQVGAALLAVLDQHPVKVDSQGNAWCDGGYCVDAYGDALPYPCTPVEVIARELGVTL